MSLCVYLLGGALLAAAPGERWELRWTHSVERTEWREVWRDDRGRLAPAEARVKGAGAGLEPGEGARLVDGWWVWRPSNPPLERLTLAASDFTAEHVLCAGDDCRPLSRWAGGVRDVPLELRICE